MTITDADCQACGACCQTSRPPDPHAAASCRAVGLPFVGTWANCTGEDLARMPRRVRLRMLPVKSDDGTTTRATPLRADGTCGFLRGELGKAVRCSIYDVRPTICRKYPAGSELCRASRREIGLPA